MIGELQAQVTAGLREGATKAQDYGDQILSRLEQINFSLRDLAKPATERAFESVRVEAGETERIDTKIGRLPTIELVSAVMDGAGTVDIFVGSQGASGFRHRLRATGADNVQSNLSEIEISNGAPIFVVAGGTGATVNLQVKREKA